MSDPTAPREGNEPGGELVPFEPAPPVPASDTSYEIALDEHQAAAAELAHPLEGIPLPSRGERHPVIPVHLRTWTGVRATAARHGGLVAHRGAYHAVRSPAYLLLMALWAVYGFFVTLGRVIRWWWLAEQTHLRSQAVISGDVKE